MSWWGNKRLIMKPKITMNRIYRILPTIVVALSLFLVFLLRYCDTISDQALLGLIASIATIYFGILKQQIESDKLFKELFESFNERYDSSYNDIFNGLRNGKNELCRDHRLKVIDYFKIGRASCRERVCQYV